MWELNNLALLLSLVFKINQVAKPGKDIIYMNQEARKNV